MLLESHNAYRTQKLLHGKCHIVSVQLRQLRSYSCRYREDQRKDNLVGTGYHSRQSIVVCGELALILLFPNAFRASMTVVCSL
jgi:hypothetical protein